MKKFFWRAGFLAVGVAALLLPLASQAAQLTSTQISAIINLLQSFGADASVITNVQTALSTGISTSAGGGVYIRSNANALVLMTALHEGDDGDGVRTLQIALAADTGIYPEGLITGHFGPLTAKAVKRFQKKHGLDQVGHVGSRTREKINKLLAENSVENEDSDGEHRPCAKIPPGHLIAPGWLRKHGGERPLVPPCQTLPPGIAKKLHDNDNATTTPPASDVTAPIISNLTAKSTTATTTQIKWRTNEMASSALWYATSTPVISARPRTRISIGGLLFNRVFNVNGLTASSTYHYFAVSSDAAGNTATSSEQALTTL